jgi:hypothetical protein
VVVSANEVLRSADADGGGYVECEEVSTCGPFPGGINVPLADVDLVEHGAEGNCLLFCMLTITKGDVDNVAELRKLLVAHCANAVEGTLLQQEISRRAKACDQTVNDYLEYLGEDGTWGDIVLHIAFAQVYACDVVSWEKVRVNGGGKEVLRHCSSYLHRSSPPQRVLNLAHVNFKGKGDVLNHFQVVDGVSASVQARTFGASEPVAHAEVKVTVDELYQSIFRDIETADGSFLLPADVLRRLPRVAKSITGSVCISSRAYVNEKAVAARKAAELLHVIDVSGNTPFTASEEFPGSYQVSPHFPRSYFVLLHSEFRF